MLIRNALSPNVHIDDACREAAAQIRTQMQGAEIDLCIVFASEAFGDKARQVPSLITQELDPQRLIGCGAGGVVGNSLEIEGLPGVSITACALPGVDYDAVHLIEEDLPDGDSGPQAWIDVVGADPEITRGLLTIADPFRFPIENLIRGLDFAYPKATQIGGLASGSPAPGTNSLFLDQTCYHEGAVLLSLGGAIEVDSLVAQGCRPFGGAGRLSKIEGHQILEIEGRPALQFLNAQIETLSEAEVQRARQAPLFLGIAMDAFATEAPQPGDYLIRQMMGVDVNRGSLGAAAHLSLGRHVQFHLRDAEASTEDLRAVLQRGLDTGTIDPDRNQGALLFSCLGRGEDLYGHPSHDSKLFREMVGPMPLGGFFCNGEIGPVQGETQIHGFTSVFGLLSEPGS